MQHVKKSKEYTVYKKTSGRYAVMDANCAYIRGDAKTKILVKEGLIKHDLPKPKAEKADAPAAEAKKEETPAS